MRPRLNNTEHSVESSLLSWVSPLQDRPSGGGTYAVNYQASRALEFHYCIDRKPPIPIQARRVDAWISRIRRRLLKLPGSFPVFSDVRLRRNGMAVSRCLSERSPFVFFKGTTNWSLWKPDRAFACYTDVSFPTFFQNTFDSSDFCRDDIFRICGAERGFLDRADAVFFESHWGLEETRRIHGLEGRNFVYAGRGGNLPIPEADEWDGRSLRLVTMAKHFRQKGGDYVLDAFRRLKSDFPLLSWSILGGEPDFDWKQEPGATYEGFLNPDRPSDLGRMQEILRDAFLLLHPTREDTNPLVITEAAYFGCPSVSVRKFAIPELIRDGETGLLIDAPVATESLIDAIQTLLEEREYYLEMRRQARAFALANFTWDQVGERMAARIHEILERRLSQS